MEGFCKWWERRDGKNGRVFMSNFNSKDDIKKQTPRERYDCYCEICWKKEEF